MTYVKASYDSSSGLIVSEWSNEKNLVYKCTVPVSTELRLPIMGEKVTINGVEHCFDEFECKDGCAVIRLASGEYVFEEK